MHSLQAYLPCVVVVAMLTSVCADETAEITVVHGIVDVASSHGVIAVPTPGAPFSFFFHVNGGDFKNRRTRKQVNGVMVFALLTKRM